MKKNAFARRGALSILLPAVMLLGACEHYEYAYKEQPAPQMAYVAPAMVSTPSVAGSNACADSFNQALDNLISAMNQTSTAQRNAVRMTAALSEPK